MHNAVVDGKGWVWGWDNQVGPSGAWRPTCGGAGRPSWQRLAMMHVTGVRQPARQPSRSVPGSAGARTARLRGVQRAGCLANARHSSLLCSLQTKTSCLYHHLTVTAAADPSTAPSCYGVPTEDTLRSEDGEMLFGQEADTWCVHRPLAAGDQVRECACGAPRLLCA